MENVKHVTNGRGHGTLTKKGIRQAKAAGKKLRTKRIAAIYSSDLKRARDTAKHIAKFHKVPVYYTKALRELNYGPFEGHYFSRNELERDEGDILFATHQDKGRRVAQGGACAGKQVHGEGLKTP